MAFEPPKLPYAEDALEPVLSKRQVDLHYNKHTAKYYEVMNTLIKGTVYDSMTDLSEFVTRDMMATVDSKLFNNACQAWNHTFYWSILTEADKSGEPSEALKKQIDEDFRSFDAFKKKLSDAATDAFGSGWAWLVWSDNRLVVKTTPNARTPRTEDRQIPLFNIDVWEHAYLYDEKYAADRKAYVNNIWNILNWDAINANFDEAVKKTA